MLKDCKIHHIGYAVKSIERTAAYYTANGWTQSEAVFDPVQQTNISFLTKEGCQKIELVEDVQSANNERVRNAVGGGKKQIDNILSKVGVSPYHVCYETKDIETTIAELRKQRFLMLFKPVEAVAMDNKRICYLMHPEVGLIELVEQ